MSSLLSAEIAAACNSLGYFDGKKYQKDRYCLETVKELIRHLRRDRANHEARCLLGEAKVLQKDLIPLLTDYHEDKELFNILLRLLVNLTHPVLLLFGEEEPSDPQQRQLYLTILSHQQEYKKAFIVDSALSVLAVRLSKLLEIVSATTYLQILSTLTLHLIQEWNERDEDTSLTIERILILVRNILQVPADLTEEQRADNDASIHDQVLWACHTSGINPIFLYLASTETEQNFYMHILEILSQMLREQNATQLATAAAARSVEERRKDENELTKLRQAENEARQAKLKQFRGARHSKFGGTYYLKNVKSVSERDLISHKPLHSIAAIDFDLNKTKVKTPKNRRPEGTEIIERRSAYSVRLFLKELCVEFLNGAYNALMFHVKESLVRNRGQENDETYYLWAMRFFMEFNRSYKFRIELVSETMSVQTFHWVQNQLDRCHEMLIMLKKNRRNWVKRQHHALKAYQELLMTLQAMDKCGDDSVQNSARVIKSNIFYVVEYREMSQMLLQSYDPTKLPTNYLRDLIETNHVFLKMLEHFCKTSHLMVQKRKRKSKPKKKKKTKEPGVPEVKSAEELWEEGVAEELSAVIQSDPQIPENLPLPFYASSELSEVEQKTVCIRRIQNYMKQREFAEAIAMFKAACEFWPELCTNEEDGEGEQTDDQFVALKEIFLAELPPGEYHFIAFFA
ncbi:hypothetical protein B566_EDAN018125 [Ephemera danica]|nr:hypothetical protein B566_EDAN018125 [Ephemera danica]